jgi:polyhydroxyalkanoate synthase subunit PhaC
VISSFFELLIEQQVASYGELQRTWQRCLSVPSLVEQARQPRVGKMPHDIVFQKGTIKLLRYRRETPAAYSEPLLLCYALVNRPHILDLQPDKSVVRQYVAQGFDVYMLDWGVPSEADRSLGLEDYVCGFLKDVVSFILEAHDREDLNLLGYCMGGTMSALLTSLYPDRIKNLTLLAAPIDFSGRNSLLHLWTAPEYFDVDALINSYGNCPAPFLQACFVMMKPVQNLVEKYLAFYDQMDDRRLVANFFAMESWVNDNIPIAGETFREFVKKLYQGNELVRGVFHLGGRRVDLRRIACPLLLLTAKNDHLVSPQSTEGVLPHVRSRDVKTMMIDAGHVGLVVSGKAHKTFWPEATRWLADRSTPSMVLGRPLSAAMQPHEPEPILE